MRKSSVTFVAAIVIALLVSATAAQTPDINAKIREAANAGSQIMRTLHFLTDVYGPRTTGSPNLKAAGQWAVETMESWGLKNGRLESWEFGHPGWANERVSAHITAPLKDQLTCEVLAWTPGTNGPVSGRAFNLILPERPSHGELAFFLDRFKSEVRGKIVLVGASVLVPVNLTPPPRRTDDERVREQFDPDRTVAGRGRGGPPRTPPPMSNAEISRAIDEFLLANGALVRVNDAGRELGQIIAFHNSTYDVTKVVPTVVMRNEDYGRIARILADNTPVTLEFDIVNRVFPEGRTAYNAVAEIEGADKKNEVVMIGGHLDAWHSATGATDNAIGCAVMMEVVRILKTIGVQPRRTIRVALWGGEEQGLLGSQAYVRQHFGSFDDQKPEYLTLAAYLNLDNGTGRVRGAEVFGPPSAATIVRNALAPFADLGVAGAIAIRNRTLGSSDHSSFSTVGLPGINFRQDPIEYDAFTHHTNLDTYERVIEGDAKSSAIAIAATVYELAMSDSLLPRFKKEDMPSLEQR
jgi:carboxypeptidase Q